jgi:hypothetical protein
MTHADEDNSRDKLRQDLEDKQKNILWPDTLRNARGVDEFLWKGSPRPTVVQRVGLGIFGFFYLVGGVALFLIISPTLPRILVGVPLGILWAGFGAKILRNAFRRKRPGA